MGYFDDIRFIGGDVHPVCRSRIAHSFPSTFNLQLVLSGRMYFQVNNGTRNILDSPSLFWHHPGPVYRYGPADGDGWYHNWFSFCGKRGRQIMRNGFSLLSPEGYVNLHRVEEVKEIFQRIVNCIRNSYPEDHSEAVVLLEQLLCVLESEKKQQYLKESPYTILFKELTDRIHQYPERAYDFDKTAGSFSLSYSHFRFLFRKYSGRSPHDYLLFCRMLKAAEKLRYPNVQVKETAIELGYDDPAQFSKLFKSQIGVSPLQYRQAVTID